MERFDSPLVPAKAGTQMSSKKLDFRAAREMSRGKALCLSERRSAQTVAGEHFAHRIDQLRLWNGALGLRLLLQMLFAALFRFRQFGADDQILDGDFAARFFVGALDDDARRIAPVGIFHLQTEFSRPEIKFG